MMSIVHVVVCDIDKPVWYVHITHSTTASDDSLRDRKHPFQLFIIPPAAHPAEFAPNTSDPRRPPNPPRLLLTQDRGPSGAQIRCCASFDVEFRLFVGNAHVFVWVEVLEQTVRSGLRLLLFF